MEQFLANLRIILPVIGLDMLKPQPRAVTQTAKPVEERTTGDVQFEICHKSGVQATAEEEDGEFIVLEGSEALTGYGYVQQSYGGLKEKLIADGLLIPHGADRLRFAKPWPFNSPSAAAAVVLDRNSNGFARRRWLRDVHADVADGPTKGRVHTHHQERKEPAGRPKRRLGGLVASVKRTAQSTGLSGGQLQRCSRAPYDVRAVHRSVHDPPALYRT